MRALAAALPLCSASVFNSETINTATQTLCEHFDTETAAEAGVGNLAKVSYLGCLYHEHCRRVFGLYPSSDVPRHAYSSVAPADVQLTVPVWWEAQLLPLLTRRLNTTTATFAAARAVFCGDGTLAPAIGDSLALMSWGFWLTSELEWQRHQSNGSLPLCNNGLPTCGPGQILQPSTANGFQCACSQKQKGDFFVHSSSDTQCVTRGIDDTSSAMTTAVIAVIVFQSLMLGITLSSNR